MSYQNRLLAALSDADGALLRPHLNPVELALGTVLVEPDKVITHATFAESGLCSVIASGTGAARIEIGLFGRDGMAAPALVLGADRVPH